LQPPQKAKQKANNNTRRNSRPHILFQVAVPLKKPSQAREKTKTRGKKSKTSEKEFTKPDARLINSSTTPNDQNRVQSV